MTNYSQAVNLAIDSFGERKHTTEQLIARAEAIHDLIEQDYATTEKDSPVNDFAEEIALKQAVEIGLLPESEAARHTTNYGVGYRAALDDLIAESTRHGITDDGLSDDSRVSVGQIREVVARLRAAVSS
jgi:hypothetical protein